MKKVLLAAVSFFALIQISYAFQLQDLQKEYIKLFEETFNKEGTKQAMITLANILRSQLK